MPYMLKQNQPEFDVVDGPMVGHKFRRGIVYETVPDGDKGRFEEVKAAAKSTVAPKVKPPAETKKNAGSEDDKPASVGTPKTGKGGPDR